jgi:threonine dehydratase
MPHPDRLAPLIDAAAERIGRYARVTRCARCDDRHFARGAELYLKLENEQDTGSFKLRGAANKVLSLTAEERSRGLYAASSGNHGAGLAWMGRALGIRPRVFVHVSADAAKVERIRALGAEVVLLSAEALDTETFARESARADGAIYVSPYNDEAVVCGQGTIGLELARQVERLDAVYVSVGGGGLIGGIGAYLKARAPRVRVIGVLPDRSPVMAESVRAGKLLDLPIGETLSDATAGGIEAGSITFPICQRAVDDWMLVSEAEIAEGMRWYIDRYGTPIEGSAAVALAGFARRAAIHAGQRVAVVICSGNVSPATLAQIGR